MFGFVVDQRFPRWTDQTLREELENPKGNFSSKPAIDIVAEIKGKERYSKIYTLRAFLPWSHQRWRLPSEKQALEWRKIKRTCSHRRKHNGGYWWTAASTTSKRCWHSHAGDSVHHTRHIGPLQTIPRVLQLDGTYQANIHVVCTDNHGDPHLVLSLS